MIICKYAYLKKEECAKKLNKQWVLAKAINILLEYKYRRQE